MLLNFSKGKLQRNKIKAHPKYPYGILREDIQEMILDKMQLPDRSETDQRNRGKWYGIHRDCAGVKSAERYRKTDPEI